MGINLTIHITKRKFIVRAWVALQWSCGSGSGCDITVHQCRRDAFTCRRLVLRRRAWKELGVSMVCCLERAAWGALTELCLNQGRDILRRLLCCLRAGGGVVAIAPARHVRGCRARARGRAEGASRRPAAASVRSRGTRATGVARHPLRRRSLSRPLTTQPPYRATFPEFIQESP